MSETLIPKLNLKALKAVEAPKDIPILEEAKSTALISEATSELSPIAESTPVIKVPEIGTKSTKISLGTIKKTSEVQEKTEVGVKIEEIPLPKNSLSGEKITQENNSLPIVGNPAIVADMGNNAPSEEILEFIKTEALEDLKSHEIKEEVKQDPITFQNYESGFKKQSGNVLKRIQNFRYTPKTRAGLLIGLTLISFLGITFLMILFPEKHSLSVYKASILELTKEKTPEKISSTEIIPPEIVPIEPTDTIVVPEETSQEIISEENMSEDDGGEKSETSVKRQEQKEKLRQFILKKYTS